MRKTSGWISKKIIFLAAAAVFASSTLSTAQDTSIFSVLNVPFPGIDATAISASSADNVWTVTGTVSNSSLADSLNFNGTSWAPLPLAEAPVLVQSIAAISSTDVWAVGYDPGSDEHELVEHFDGTGWEVVRDAELVGKTLPAPVGFVAGETLESISAISADDIFAAGYILAADTNLILPFIEHWNGSKWSELPIPPSALKSSITFIKGISALSDKEVWIVGSAPGTKGTFSGQAVAFLWNGSTWTQTPTAADCSCAFEAVKAIASDDVWAVGGSESGAVGNGLMAQHWNGKTWTLTPVPPANVATHSANEGLLSVAAVSSTSVWAVGEDDDQLNFSDQPFVEHWDGTKWRLELLPFCPLQSCGLISVAALPSGELWAAGPSRNPDRPLTPFIIFTNQGK